ncbi:MAG: caspase family protein [Fimbriimonadaceae bacterium]|nr:caspase family protein [Fimbriimonadaceae bacterium]
MAKSDHYAILVAINRYPGLTDLAGPENDANEFLRWLIDPAGGDLEDPTDIGIDERRVEVIRSCDFPATSDPDDANPTETQFKKILNRWLRCNGEWRERVGERLYLFFAGHGFTSGALPDPALFTAQAQLGDTAHIAANRYAAKIQNAGFFDEVILIMDCCQDVLKASQVGDPTWSPPDRQRSGAVKLMQAFGAPRGRKAFETQIAAGATHGYFSSVFMEAVRSASADKDGFVMADAVADRFFDLWSDRYLKVTGYVPPVVPPRNLRLYRRSNPGALGPDTPVPPGGGTGDGVGMLPPSGPESPSPAMANADAIGDYSNLRSADGQGLQDQRSQKQVVLSARDPGAQIRVLNARRSSIAEGVGRLEVALPEGRYTARFRVGDVERGHDFEIAEDESTCEVHQASLEFSSPIPLPETRTHHEYHYHPVMDLASEAVKRAVQTGFPDSVATLMIFARDSAHSESATWRIDFQVREGLRLTRLDDETGEPRTVACEISVDERRGYSAVLLNDLRPGTYLLGVRRRQGDIWLWQEMVLTLASSWWRTEVYLDSVDDEFTGRRFDLDSASVLVEPGWGSGSLYGSEARFAEVARIALTEGRVGVDDHLLDMLAGQGIPSPMLALYTAYALALQPKPPVDRVRTLCEHLNDRWTRRSADVKLLQHWCEQVSGRDSSTASIDFRPDEVPMINLGWDIAERLGKGARVSEAAQRRIGSWRTASALWTQTQVPSDFMKPVLAPYAAASLPHGRDGRIDYAAVCNTLVGPSEQLSPLQQTLRRTLINARENEELDSIGSALERIGAASGVGPRVVQLAIEGMLSSAVSSQEQDSAVEGRREPATGTMMRIKIIAAEFLAQAIFERFSQAPAFSARIGDPLSAGVLAMNRAEAKTVTIAIPSLENMSDVARLLWSGVQELAESRPETAMLLLGPVGEETEVKLQYASEQVIADSLERIVRLDRDV